MITEEKINSNFTLYQKRLAKDYSVDIEKLDKELPRLKDASFGISVDNGCAYPGSLIDKSIKLTSIAVKINANVLGDDEVDKGSLVKVCMLQHISKAKTLVPNDNEWEINKRGYAYKYNEENTVIKTGALSSYIAMRCGVEFTDEELEAMTIIDRDGDDRQANYYASKLAVVVRTANEILSVLSKEEAKKGGKK